MADAVPSGGAHSTGSGRACGPPRVWPVAPAQQAPARTKVCPVAEFRARAAV